VGKQQQLGEMIFGTGDYRGETEQNARTGDSHTCWLLCHKKKKTTRRDRRNGYSSDDQLREPKRGRRR
jgi:hypothetical protein